MLFNFSCFKLEIQIPRHAISVAVLVWEVGCRRMCPSAIRSLGWGYVCLFARLYAGLFLAARCYSSIWEVDQSLLYTLSILKYWLYLCVTCNVLIFMSNFQSDGQCAILYELL